MSMVLDSNEYPVIAYSSITSLKLMHCNDDCCVGGDETINTLFNLGAIVQGISVQLDMNGIPAISFFTGSILQIARCTTPSCSGFVSIDTLDSDSPTGQYTSLQFCGGQFDLPVISYFNVGNQDLMITCSLNPEEQSNQPSVSPLPCDNVVVDNFTAPDVGWFTSMACAPSTGFPVVAYQGVTETTLQLVICGDRLCTSGNVYVSTLR